MGLRLDTLMRGFERAVKVKIQISLFLTACFIKEIMHDSVQS